jgi:hypothetical protein
MSVKRWSHHNGWVFFNDLLLLFAFLLYYFGFQVKASLCNLRQAHLVYLFIFLLHWFGNHLPSHVERLLLFMLPLSQMKSS